MNRGEKNRKLLFWGKSYGCKNCFNFPRSLTHSAVEDNNGLLLISKQRKKEWGMHVLGSVISYHLRIRLANLDFSKIAFFV